MHLRTRIFIYFALLICIAVVVVSTLSLTLFSSYIGNLILEYRRDIVFSSLGEIEQIRLQQEKIANQILSNPQIQEMLSQPIDRTQAERLHTVTEINNLLTSLSTAQPNSSILLLDMTGQYYRSSEEISPDANPEAFSVLMEHDEFRMSRGKSIWISLQYEATRIRYGDSLPEPSRFYLIKKINHLQAPHQQIGLLIMTLDYARIADILEQTSQHTGERSLLATTSGVILAHTGGSADVGTSLDSSDAQGLAELLNLESTYLLRKSRMGVSQYLRRKGSDWIIIQYTPFLNLFGKSQQVRNLIFIAGGVFMLAAFAVAYLVSTGITRPIRRLSEVIKDFGSGRLDLRSPLDRTDEIGMLQESFNQMADDMKRLMDKIDDENARRRKLELTVLEYQINPHFLYNILDSINWMAQKAGQRDIGAMVTSLARFYRIGLSSGHDLISIEEEIEHARNFLMICQMRQRECFTFDIRLDDEIRTCKTPKVILQPVIENSIKHGMNRKTTDGKILITCNAEGGDIVFRVIDNGKGIDFDTLEQIRDRLAREEADESYGGGIGLLNIHQRLRLACGHGYGLSIESDGLGCGTRVVLRVPRAEA